MTLIQTFADALEQSCRSSSLSPTDPSQAAPAEDHSHPIELRLSQLLVPLRLMLSQLETLLAAPAQPQQVTRTFSRSVDKERLAPLLKEMNEYLQRGNARAVATLPRLAPLLQNTPLEAHYDRLATQINEFDFDHGLRELHALMAEID